MCGIAGIVYFDGRKADKKLLYRMNQIQYHRGPDDSGIFFEKNVGLVHRRLSIIDLSEFGHQPMSNEDGCVWITYNGEIYNYQEIRAELIKRGHQFMSATDTEVIIHAYEEFGVRCLSLFNGMFAFAIFDQKSQELFLARDRFGIKPLNYYLDNKQLVFASEVKAILLANVKREFDKDRVTEYILYGFIQNATFFKEIVPLEAGTYMLIHTQTGQILKQEKWYDVCDFVNQKQYEQLTKLEENHLLEQAEENLKKSVKRRMVSDVPIGTLCSGGIDSSLITAIATKFNQDTSVYNVNVRYSPEYSEVRYADIVAKHLGIQLRTFELTAENFIQGFAQTIYYNDMPLMTPNSVPIFYISEIAYNDGVKVLLTGEGADELLGGYNWRYQNQLIYYKFQKYYQFVPWCLRKPLSKLLQSKSIADLSFKTEANFESLIFFLVY